MKRAPLLLLLGLLATPLHAAELLLASELVVDAVNGEKRTNLLFGNAAKLTLAAGEQRLLVRYKDLFELGADEHEVVSSEALLLAFTLPAEGNYQLQLDAPSNVKAARAFAKAPQLRLIDAKGQPIAMTILTEAQQQQLWQAAATPTASATATTAVPAAIGATAVTAAAAAQGNGEQQMVSEQLHYWWQKADAQTRQQFLQQLQQP